MKVTWVDSQKEKRFHFHGCPWCGDRNEVHPMKECLIGGEVLGDLVREAIDKFEEPISDEKLAVELLDIDYVVKIPPVREYVQPVVITEVKKATLLSELEIDSTMVGTILRRSAQNTTENVWRKCYPGAFWVRGEKRLADPSSKSQCVGDIRPGTTRDFRVMIPRFPLGEKPDLLRIAVLENGVGWHTVEDIRVR